LEEVSTVSNNDSRQSADDADPLTDKKHGNKIRRLRVLMVDRGKGNAVAAARQTPPSSETRHPTASRRSNKIWRAGCQWSPVAGRLALTNHNYSEVSRWAVKGQWKSFILTLMASWTGFSQQTCNDTSTNATTAISAIAA